MIEKRIAFVGGGQMAEALIGGLTAGGLCRPDAIWTTDPVSSRRDRLKQAFGIRVGEHNPEAVKWADIVVLAVKPPSLPGVLEETGSSLGGRVTISIVAGTTIASIRRHAPSAKVVRAMPNQPAVVREGVTALSPGTSLSEVDLQSARAIFEAVGRTVVIEERLMDAVTGLSGSGPAYVFLAIEALADGGVKMGLSRETAELLAAQTVLGAAQMVLKSGEHPARLKDRVASPGGTTIAGLHALEQGGFRATLMGAVEAATRRSQELGR